MDASEIMNIRTSYLESIPNLEKMRDALVADMQFILKDQPNIDQICGRVKSEKRFIQKAEREHEDKESYKPLVDITDQIGLRIVVFYEKDVDTITEIIKKNYVHIEEDKKTKNELEFGYEAVHYLLSFPPQISENLKIVLKVKFFELQVCTLFQHAWAQANHEISYNPRKQLDRIYKKKVTWAASLAWGADRVFSELLTEVD